MNTETKETQGGQLPVGAGVWNLGAVPNTIDIANRQLYQNQMSQRPEGEAQTGQTPTAHAMTEMFLRFSEMHAAAAAQAKAAADMADLQTQWARFQSSTMDPATAAAAFCQTLRPDPSLSSGQEALAGASAMLALQDSAQRKKPQNVPPSSISQMIQQDEQQRLANNNYDRLPISDVESLASSFQAQGRHQQDLQQLIQLQQLKPPSVPSFPQTASDDSSTASLSQSTGYVVAPCPARGMSIDHNFKTAYFVIKNDIKHGDELTCSFRACRNSGVKFRYCEHCKIPVAKRNFTKSHTHNGDAPPAKKTSEKKSSKRPSAIAQHITNSSCAVVSGESDNSVSTSQSTVLTNVKRDKDKTSRKKHHHSSSGSKRKREKTSEGSERKREKSSEGNERKRSERRPSEEAKMLLNQLCGVAGKELRKEAAGEDAKAKEEKWASLLEERPSSGDKSALSKWLVNVLSISEDSNLVEKAIRTFESN